MIHLTNFTGAFPVVPAHLLPDNAAQYAKNCDVRHGELKPLSAPVSVLPSLSGSTKGVFTPDGYHVLASATPLYAYLSPTVGDVNDRVYYTNGDGLRVCKWSDANASGAFPASWKVGVPAPKAALKVRKNRKNRWPNYPNTQLKAKLFLESPSGRHLEEAVSLSQTPGSIPFSSYSATASTNVAQLIADAKAAETATSVSVGSSTMANGLVITAPVTYNGVTYQPGTMSFSQPRRVTVMATQFGAEVLVDAVGEESALTVPSSSVSHIIMLDGSSASLALSGSEADATAVPSEAKPGLEVWLENTDNPGERIWTVYTTNSSAGSIPSIPGGGEVTMRATGDTAYEISMSFGIIEDRAYVYTMFNDWQEESMSSEPATVSVTYMDDVVLEVDYDACVTQLEGYRPLDHLQFYRSTNGEYVGIKTVPATTDDVTSLYTSVLGRDPDASGLSYWQDQYNKGMSLSEIASRMMDSREYRDATSYLAVEDLYLKLLGRSPDTSGFAYWRNKYEAGVPMSDIIYSFLVSPEFIPQNHSSMPSVSWFYSAFLNRAPDADGLAFWTAHINANGTRGYVDMVRGMLNSTEYKTVNADRHLSYMLSKVLGRSPSSAELESAKTKYLGGYSLNAVTASTSAITQDGFKDEGKTLGFTLPSLEWNEPPAGVNKLAQLPNGVFAATVDNYVYFSEPYRPFAWPATYGQALPANVVSLMPFDGQLLVTTTTSPLMISGAHPQGMTQQRIGANEAATSEFGLTVAGGHPIYASKEGLVVVEGLSGSLAMSNSFFSAEKWREKYAARASQIVLIGFDSRLIGLFPSGDGFIINLGATPNLVEFSQVAGYPFRIPGEEALYLATPSGSVKLFFGATMSYEWWSKEYTLPAQFSYGACKVVHDGSATIKFYGNGALIHTQTLTANGWKESAFRLPAGRYLRFSFKVEAACRLQEVHIVRTMRELSNG